MQQLYPMDPQWIFFLQPQQDWKAFIHYVEKFILIRLTLYKWLHYWNIGKYYLQIIDLILLTIVFQSKTIYYTPILFITQTFLVIWEERKHSLISCSYPSLKHSIFNFIARMFDLVVITKFMFIMIFKKCLCLIYHIHG